MRDTVIAVLVLLGTSGIYFVAKHFQNKGNISSTSSKLLSPSAASRKKLSRIKNSKQIHQGEQNESASHRGRQQVESDIESVGSEEGASSSFEQAQSLPSIYQDEEPENSGSAVDLENDMSSEGNESAVDKPKQPIIYGIPVASWLKHQKNRLAPRVELTHPTGMRLFFNCMEIKKDGAQTLNQRDCKEVAVSREKSKGAALIQ